MKKIFQLLFAIVLISNTTFAQNIKIESAIDSIFKAMNKKEYAILKPLLDDNVKTGDLPTGMNDYLFPQVLAQFPAPNSYKIIDVLTEGINTRVMTEFYTPENKTFKHNFLFNEKRKIIEMNILNEATALVQKMEERDESQSIMPNIMNVPFKVKDGIMIVEAEVNGKKVNFIVDSGAPILVLNSKHFANDTNNPQTNISGVKGVNGEIEGTGVIKVDSFKWLQMEIPNFDAIKMDLSHLEKELNTKIYGLIGYDIFKNYELTFNYKSKILTLNKVDSLGNSIEPYIENKNLICAVPFKLDGHIPVVSITIENNQYQMGIDCGAAEDLLYAKYIDKITNTSKIKTGKLMGADKKVQEIKSGKIKSYTIGTAMFKNSRTAFSDESLNQLNDGYGMKLDGLIGYEFLKQHITTINYNKKEIRFYDNL